MQTSTIQWIPQGETRVPLAVYRDDQVFADEQRNIYRGDTWNYLCLENEIPESGDYRTTFVGETPVVVARDADGEIYAFENRCTHRGALICLEKSGKDAKDFQCVYHAWTYSLKGDLKGVAFEGGVNGAGGMPEGFCKDHHHPTKLRVAIFCGLVFGSFSDDVDPLEEYLGDEICARIERVLGRPVEVIGRFTQALPNNWKLYYENVKDTYHASLLHLFFTTFRLNRLSQEGGVIVSETGAHHVSYSKVDEDGFDGYKDQGLRSDQSGYQLKDPSLLQGFKEFDDGITLQILSVFPGFVLQQIQNCLAIRQVLPRGIDKTDLNWTYIGYVSDTPAQREVRLKQANLIGAAGFVSMEDGAVGGFVQRGIAGTRAEQAVLEMGGDSTASSSSRATEAAVRGFWKQYRVLMGV
ncbi:Terephthalate 1,2-dioxygenase, terminal oxygenase component subunit alpha 1 [Fusarium oxysporum f. sp. narcissi]|jgi:phenylpropionate dioxygenase-like ring-hydroxylating dioxygenase large terminal subunit|uniref:Choline monooxygenase, chloroplastic n=2 Tax=Fusarium TaxID=5506 RepID=A0A4Q2UY61_FUSOX|nr:Rieske 2Fe-2S domain-containing protein [Piscinibacter defluvii]RKL19577.1 Terephthalate 1,2-dioxygenase, terminal oxygenase component subunit alpha 1 [Fusarium proliferatum]RYC79495.1 Terephthalate 1,2-dioxygenase, terminal oxygenase component subunit alpha 1 [Fusarium oxysporum f. sp. narcissi]